MKILVLEDNQEKLDAILNVIKSVDHCIDFSTASTFHRFHKFVEREVYDLIIVDLLAPQFVESTDPIDLTEQIIDSTRDHSCINFRTPVIAVTGFDEIAEENFDGLNGKDITVVTYSPEKHSWGDSLRDKINSCIPPITFPFVIVCALPKEAEGFISAGYRVGPTREIHGLECREISIGGVNGVIVTSPRMGLVNSAIVCTLATELFKPKLLCMSGICAGIEKKAKIYDIVIPDIVHQYDFGKWGDNGFELEPYSVQILPDLRLRLAEILGKSDFKESISNGVSLNRSEFPDGDEHLSFEIKLAPASSGSAVVSNDDFVSLIKEQHRKMTAFEMESFSVYESARLASVKPYYFSAKCVVDDGGASKGDRFHRVACILSAKVVYELILGGVVYF